MMNSEIKTGDTVTLKGGKLQMIVGYIDPAKNTAKCYFEVFNRDNPIQEKEIELVVLNKIK